MEHHIDPRRIRQYNGNGSSSHPGSVLYWMHREFRAQDNWALLHARLEALERQVPLAVAFCMAPGFLGATLRQFDFLLKGLEASMPILTQANIPLILRSGEPEEEIIRLCTELHPSLVVTDFDPLRIKRQWFQALLKHQNAPVHEVDSRNIVPAWIASPRREYMARTIRPKIHRLLPEFLTPFPLLPPHPYQWATPPPSLSFSDLHNSLQVDRSVVPVDRLQPGESSAHRVLNIFLTKRLSAYDQRNDPNKEVCSDLSSYLHFGMISAQAVVLELKRRGLRGDNVDSFVEELVVRRELSDNFCLYTADYDQVSSFPDWAQRTLEDHRKDPRAYLYSLEEFDRGETHDPLWNAAQRQLVVSGAMHGYMRMYWAKKILEWTPEASEALRIAIFLNDRYALDGRESNGYTGIAWSIGGVHDRGWTKRPIFGSIRYMNESGARRKFDVQHYIRTWSGQQPPCLFA
ncbi:MAG: deoxyribodipyrimidine photo-lyase [Desulfobulbus sp.]|nr:deoxyribodipyrimidine photo-lyase [Desulfobulbus sp.]